MNQVLTLTPYFFKCHFNIILPNMSTEILTFSFKYYPCIASLLNVFNNASTTAYYNTLGTLISINVGHEVLILRTWISKSSSS